MASCNYGTTRQVPCSAKPSTIQAPCVPCSSHLMGGSWSRLATTNRYWFGTSSWMHQHKGLRRESSCKYLARGREKARHDGICSSNSSSSIVRKSTPTGLRTASGLDALVAVPLLEIALSAQPLTCRKSHAHVHRDMHVQRRVALTAGARSERDGHGPRCYLFCSSGCAARGCACRMSSGPRVSLSALGCLDAIGITNVKSREYTDVSRSSALASPAAGRGPSPESTAPEPAFLRKNRGKRQRTAVSKGSRLAWF